MEFSFKKLEFKGSSFDGIRAIDSNECIGKSIDESIIENTKQAEERKLKARLDLIENCWRMIVGDETPNSKDGFLDIQNNQQTPEGLSNIYTFWYKCKAVLSIQEVISYGVPRYFMHSDTYTLDDYMRTAKKFP